MSAGAEAPILRPPNVKSELIGKDPDAGKDWGPKEEAVEAEIASIADAKHMNLSKILETAEDRGAWRTVVHGVSDTT